MSHLQTKFQKYYYIKEDGAPELNYQLHNHHGPIVVRRCLPAGEKFSGKLTLASCSELPKLKQTLPYFV